jgi:hypothetical protein
MAGAARRWEPCPAEMPEGGSDPCGCRVFACWLPPDEAPARRLLVSYGYTRAARDALDFAALSARFIQNLMGRYAGDDVQYFAAALSRLPSPRPPDGIAGLGGGRPYPVTSTTAVRRARQWV